MRNFPIKEFLLCRQSYDDPFASSAITKNRRVLLNIRNQCEYHIIPMDGQFCRCIMCYIIFPSTTAIHWCEKIHRNASLSGIKQNVTTFSIIEFSTFRPSQKAAILQSPFSNAFYSIKMCEFYLKNQWRIIPMVQLTFSQHWFRQWIGTDQVTSHFLKQRWLGCRRIDVSLGHNELKEAINNRESSTY